MFSNLKNKMHVATQMAKEKMGKADATIETESTREIKQILKVIKKGYKKIDHSGRLYVTESERLAMAATELGDSLLLLGSGILTTTPLGQGLHTLGSELKAIASLSQNYAAATTSSLVAPIGKLLEVDIKRASDIKSHQENARLKYDMAISAQKHKHQTSDDLETSRQAYEQLTRELTEALNLVLAQIGTELMYELKTWAASQARYYNEMSQMWAGVEAKLAPLPSVAEVTTSTVVNAYVPAPPTDPYYTTSTGYPHVQNYQTSVVQPYAPQNQTGLEKPFEAVNLQNPPQYVQDPTGRTQGPVM
jgi:hypothetical protein